jgi:hypothetical protein
MKLNHKFLLILLFCTLFFNSCNGKKEKIKEQYKGTWVLIRSSTDGEDEGINYSLSQGLVVELHIDTDKEELRVVTNDGKELTRGKLTLYDYYYQSKLPKEQNGIISNLFADIKIKEDGYLHYSTGYDLDYIFEKK